jgi:hypothetical protein
MERVIGIATALIVLLTIGGAGAEEIRGKVKSLDIAARAFALEDGTRILVAEGLPMDALKEGRSVKATFETRDGDRVATSIEAD